MKLFYFVLLCWTFYSCNNNDRCRLVYDRGPETTESGCISRKTGSRVGVWSVIDSTQKIVKTVEYGFRDSFIKTTYFLGNAISKIVITNSANTVWMELNIKLLKSVDAVVDDRLGQILFANNCVVCHRSTSFYYPPDSSAFRFDSLVLKLSNEFRMNSHDSVFVSNDSALINSPHLPLVFFSDSAIKSIRLYLKSGRRSKWTD